ncbi:MAG: PAS domain-containing protein [Candidatus Omnitrophica bacterium]|nr:PAS domain-containing protein [Candidatus Omnitrophota bacterium]
MDFGRKAKMLHELKHIKEPEDDEANDEIIYQEETDSKKTKPKSSFLDFLSSKVKVFSEFEDMASFAASILRASSYPFFVVDKHMKIQYMNPACLDFTGLKLNDVIGKINCMSVFNSNLCGKSCAIKQAMATKKSVIGKRVEVQDKLGRDHTIIVSAGPLIDKKGKVLGGFEVWRDAMADEEVTLRMNHFLGMLKDYYRNMEGFFDKIEQHPFLKELKSNEYWAHVINDVKKQTKDLQNYSRNFLKSSCWDILNCPAERQIQCPAFPNHGAKCWEVNYTWCDGQMQGIASEKKGKCKKCMVYIREKILR